MKVLNKVNKVIGVIGALTCFGLAEIRGLFCKHEETTTVTNFYGDAINTFDCRSWRRCKKCDKIIKSNELDPECDKVNIWWE